MRISRMPTAGAERRQSSDRRRIRRLSSDKIAVAGAGFTGAVIARELAERAGLKVIVFEQRDHVGGNCHTMRDQKTNVMLHIYGAHIFHTSRDDIWAYVNRFAHFRPYVCRVKAITRRGVFSLPVNLLTINQFFGKQFAPHEARAFIKSLAVPMAQPPQNFEDQALHTIGRDLYETFFRGYTYKQWQIAPRELPASVFNRLPVRFSYNDDYFHDVYQGIPEEGYTELIRRMLCHPCIEVRTGAKFDPAAARDFDHVFFSGPIDSFFNWELGHLRYQTLDFERIDGIDDFQGSPAIAYCDENVPYVRIFEYKHLTPWEDHAETVAFRQYSRAMEPGDIPYYPLRLATDHELLGRYVTIASHQTNVTFVGRLGTYRYLDMNVAIGEALAVVDQFLKHVGTKVPFPAFVYPPHLPPLEQPARRRYGTG